MLPFRHACESLRWSCRCDASLVQAFLQSSQSSPLGSLLVDVGIVELSVIFSPPMVSFASLLSLAHWLSLPCSRLFPFRVIPNLDSACSHKQGPLVSRYSWSCSVLPRSFPAFLHVLTGILLIVCSLWNWNCSVYGLISRCPLSFVRGVSMFRKRIWPSMVLFSFCGEVQRWQMEAYGTFP